MARARTLRWASVAAGLGAAAFTLAFVWVVLREGAAPPALPPPVNAPPPSLGPPPAAPPGPFEAAVSTARSSYLAAVMRAPEPGVSSREIAEARSRVFDQEVERLAALGPEAVPFLQAQLAAEPVDHARLLLLTALSRIGGEAGVRGTLAALEQLQDPTLEPLFLDRLTRRSDDPESLRLLEAVLQGSPRPETRVSVLVSAARHGDRRLADRLPELALHDESALVRAQALVTAEQLGSPLPSSLLEQMAHADPDPRLRERALDALAASDPPALVGYARRTLEGGAQGAEQAGAIAQALARSSDADALALLEQLSQASDPALRTAAARALRSRSAPTDGR